jgi:hypothetical protein
MKRQRKIEFNKKIIYSVIHVFYTGMHRKQ